MKNVIATSALILSLAAPAFADAGTAAQFALSNDSAAERVLSDVSIGDTDAAQSKFALDNASAAERHIDPNADATRGNADQVRALLALGNDSAAEL